MGMGGKRKEGKKVMMEKINIRTTIIHTPVKIIMGQKAIGNLLSEDEINEIKESKPDFVCLPELFFVTAEMKNYADAANAFEKYIEYLRKLSAELELIVVGGTLIFKDAIGFKSICHIYNRGELASKYTKINLTEHEKKKGFIQGENHIKCAYRDISYTTLICNDIFSNAGFIWAKENDIKLIFMPTGSPFKPQENIEDKYRRDQELYVAKSMISDAIVIKICGVGSVFGNKLQGRSLIASPHGILFRIDPSQELHEHLLEVRI